MKVKRCYMKIISNISKISTSIKNISYTLYLDSSIVSIFPHLLNFSVPYSWFSNFLLLFPLLLPLFHSSSHSLYLFLPPSFSTSLFSEPLRIGWTHHACLPLNNLEMCFLRTRTHSYISTVIAVKFWSITFKQYYYLIDS